MRQYQTNHIGHCTNSTDIINNHTPEVLNNGKTEQSSHAEVN